MDSAACFKQSARMEFQTCVCMDTPPLFLLHHCSPANPVQIPPSPDPGPGPRSQAPRPQSRSRIPGAQIPDQRRSALSPEPRSQTPRPRSGSQCPGPRSNAHPSAQPAPANSLPSTQPALPSPRGCQPLLLCPSPTSCPQPYQLRPPSSIPANPPPAGGPAPGRMADGWRSGHGRAGQLSHVLPSSPNPAP